MSDKRWSYDDGYGDDSNPGVAFIREEGAKAGDFVLLLAAPIRLPPPGVLAGIVDEHNACVGFNPAAMREAVQLLRDCDFDRFVRSAHCEPCPRYHVTTRTGKPPACTCGCVEFWQKLSRSERRLKAATARGGGSA